MAIEHVVWWIATMKGDFESGAYSGALLAMTFGALFTAALAPYANWLIIKLHRQLGLPGQRRYSHGR